MRTATYDHTIADDDYQTQRVYELSASLEFATWRGQRRFTNFVVVSSVHGGDNIDETMVFPIDNRDNIRFTELFVSTPHCTDADALAGIGYRLDNPTP